MPSRKSLRDTLRDEYDFSSAARGVTARRYVEGRRVVLLEADVAAAFPTAKAVNEGLRALLRLGARRRRRQTASRGAATD